MDSMGIIAFLVAGSSLTFAIIAYAKYEKLERRIKELEDKVNEE